jgi:vesicle-fusing ATPase
MVGSKKVDTQCCSCTNGDDSFLLLFCLFACPPARPSASGKTHLAREMAKHMKSRPVKIVAAPELLDRWVGSTERNVRALFGEAEQELLVQCGGDPTQSALHVIVIDEIDALFRRRSSSSSDAGEVTRASAVNQILAKLDGVQSLDNILLIGMTNRPELLDPALLRPGRLEVQIEIPLPDERGRRDILNIHFGPLRTQGRLSQPLCDAIDGVKVVSSKQPKWRRRIFFAKKTIKNDLALQTKGFSGADIAGLVRNAGSIALERTRRQSTTATLGGINGLLVTLQDVQRALNESKKQ